MAPRIRRRITNARRQQIEQEQKRLENSIVRPFDVLNGLPVTFGPPPTGHYEDVLKQPLTIKDTGVFYRSLMKSRFNYVHICPMFRLYWVKQSSYAKKLAAIDKPLPKSSREDMVLTKDRVPVLGLDTSARDVMVKLCDASMTLGPHDFDIRLFIVKDERSEKPKKDKSAPQTAQPTQSGPTDPNKPSNPAPQIPKNPTPANSTTEKNGTTPSSTNTSKSNDAAPASDQNKLSSDTNLTKEKPAGVPATTKSPAPPTPAPTQAPAPAPAPPRPSPPPQSSSDPHNMQSVENTIMISNLNTIARTDESLNQLMKIVALGKATPQQISTFQGYIKRAREMGPQPHHAYLFANQPYPKSMKPPKDRKYVKDKKLKDIPRNQKLTAFQERYTNNATLLFEFVENPNVRFMLPKVAVAEVLPPSTMTNADGDDNSDNKDILISFIWVHNQKEIDTYEEKLANYNKIMEEREAEAKKIEDAKKAEEEAEKSKSEENQDKVAGEETHNEKPTGENEGNDSNESTPVVKTETIDAPANSEEKSNENEVKEEPSDTAKDVIEEPTPAKRRLPPRKASKKKKPPPRKGPKKLEKPVEPEIRFTTMSYTVHGIPSRYVPIIMNSFEPLDKVQEKMKHILDVGTRTSSFYLWFQVDGKLDEKLAEEIRSQLVQEEKKMPGVVNAVKEVKKRQKKDPLLTKAKKMKLEGNSETGTPSSNNDVNMNGPGMEPSAPAPNTTVTGQTTPAVTTNSA